MSDPPFNPFDSALNIYKSASQEKTTKELPNSKDESVYSDYTKDLTKYNKKKVRITLDEIPEDQRNRAAEHIAFEKLMKISADFAIIANNIKEKGFLSPDPNIQKDIILGSDALHDYLQPLTDDKWTQGDWKNSFEQIVSHLNKDQHWTEDPEFIRQYRYEIFGDGNVTNRHPYTSEHILGGSIIPKINKIIKIADCFPLFSALWKSDSQTRYQQIRKRENAKSDRRRVKKDGRK